MSACRRPTSRSVPQNGGTFTGIMIGLVVGVLIALGVAWYMNRTPIPFADKTGRAADRPADSRPAAAARPGGVPGTAEPVALPGKPGDKPLEKRRFDFYEILPGGESAAPPAADAKPEAPAPEPLYLQAGAYQEAADADNVKARLALLGIEAAIQQVILPDRGTLHRVRIGPFASPQEMSRARAVLAENGIQAAVVKGANGGSH